MRSWRNVFVVPLGIGAHLSRWGIPNERIIELDWWQSTRHRHRAWYSGDTSFHKDLPNIGARLGPFDVTLIEAGQYDANWPDNHLGPELAVQAHIQVRGRTMIPVHWALLKLAQHTWTEPVERVRAAARCHDVDLLATLNGDPAERVTLDACSTQ